MKLIVKQLLIVVIIFVIILWLQKTDDNKYNINRLSLYDKYKIPIFISCLIFLILNNLDYLDCLDCLDNYLTNNRQIYNQDVYIEPFL